MSEDNIIPLAKSGKSFNDALTDVLRCGAQQLLMQAVEAQGFCMRKILDN